MSRLQPIIDAHHHIWSPRGTTHPWLMPDAAIPFRYGDYSEIKSDYLPSDYDADSSDFEVVGHVTMEAEWNPDDPVAETAWTATAFEGRSDYLGHVARAFLAKDDIENVLAAHAAYPIVRGIRQKPTTQPRPSSARDAVTFGVAGGMTDPQWQRGYAMLQSHGLHFELQTPWWHIDELIALHARFPETPIVINHMFMPGDRAPETVAHWGRAIRRAAELTATTIKISGMGLPGVAWRLSDHLPLIETVIDAFGPERCMLASNFPVDKLCGRYATIIGGYLEAIANLDDASRNAIAFGTAERVYRIKKVASGSAT